MGNGSFSVVSCSVQNVEASDSPPDLDETAQFRLVGQDCDGVFSRNRLA